MGIEAGIPTVDAPSPASSSETLPRRSSLLSASERAAATRQPRPSVLASVRRPTRQGGATIISDYAYVVNDLRRIGMLAGAAIVILVALTFVVR